MKSEGKPMNYEKMQAETDVRTEKEQQELSAYPNIKRVVQAICASKNCTTVMTAFSFLIKK